MRAMHDVYDGKYLKTMSFLPEQHQILDHRVRRAIAVVRAHGVPGKLRIAFLPVTTSSGLVQADDRDRFVRQRHPGRFPSFRQSAAAPHGGRVRCARRHDHERPGFAERRHGNDPDRRVGRPPGLCNRRKGGRHDLEPDSGSIAERLRSGAFHPAQQERRAHDGQRHPRSELQGHQGFQIPTEFLVTRNGRPIWREEYAERAGQ